ncbi:Flagellar assembly protein FliH [Georgfuchsia toluolica]|uniref:Flagellar assembly protein FliH n=1 Tax=Georgfuchsia toluolica TaxID=424218 RepID=A0A916J074_9PROT|nr:flagellar assembly protein FliH [Georgfuchsia toluolica]CAG4882198.1 Flagellar assembly protein FliH [Georgfuchsia toluolica]
MSSDAPLIPKEQLTAYEFWKMDDFNQNRRGEARTELLTVTQHEALHEQARAEGYAAGYKQGEEQVALELSHLRSLMTDLNRELRRFDQGVANSLVTLALEISRQLLRNRLTEHPELVVEVVKEAMQSLPPFGEHAQLLLNPKDAELVRTHIGEQLTHSKWKLIEDSSIERGGCRVQTASIEIDGTLPIRWQRMAAVLARNEVWYCDPVNDAVVEGEPAS